MANNGLKSFTKQLSGKLGIVDYSINLYKSDKNFITEITIHLKVID